ncbi:MAG TPA: alpha/beta hydrolase, partial [Thermoleophilia bacterium]|nr:alpha/beta hydrolase [Thermoleophilia bacterium]
AASASPSAAATPGGAGGSREQPAAVHRDLAYVGASPSEKLDLYLPAGASEPYPVIVAIHGGGFMAGDKSDGQVAPMLLGLARGYAVASIDYRLSGEAKFPAQIQDVKAAIRWLRASAGRFKLDPARIAVWGDSAGGNLAALAGTSAGVAALSDPALGNSGQSDAVQAVVDWFGPISMLKVDSDFRASHAGPTGHEAPTSFESRYFGAPVRTVPGKVKAADPITYIGAGDPPFLIEHGTADSTVPVQQSQRLAAALRSALGPGAVTFRIFPGAGHMAPAIYSRANADAVLDWLDARLR